MAAPAAVHPTEQTLHSYGLGKLDDVQSEAVGKHVATCDACRRLVAALTSDTFLGRLQKAQASPATTPPVGSSLEGLPQVGGDERMPSPAPPPASTLPPGLAQHPDYQILRELGRGGMGVVYLAENQMMGRKEVLKVVSSHLLNRKGVLERFMREIRAAARLQHANIVTAYSATKLGESIVFSMQYVEGYDLAKLVEKCGPLQVAHACNFVYQAALGLQHAHEHSMVHRDIKPSNLMLAREGNKPVIKILDFGLAKVTSEGAADGGLTQEGQMLGTPHYVAPEQSVNAQKADIRADIYSLGCTLYCLLAGFPPFDAANLYELLQAHHSMDAKPLNFVRPEVPAELAALVAKMLAKEPERRFQTPGEVAKSLLPFFKKGSVIPGGAKAELSFDGDEAVDREPGAGWAGAPALKDDLAGLPVSRSRTSDWPGVETTTRQGQSESQQEIADSETASNPSTARRWLSNPLVITIGVSLLGVLIACAVWVVKVRTKDGTTVMAVLPENATVEVHGNRIALNAPKTAPLNVGPRPSRPIDKTGMPAPSVLRGRWRVDGNELVQDTLTRAAAMLFGDPAWASYDLRFQAMATEGTVGFAAVFHARGRGMLRRFELGAYSNKSHQLCQVVDGVWGRNDGMFCAGKIEFNRWYDVRVQVRGSNCSCYLDEVVLFRDDDARFTSGRVGFTTWDSKARFRNITVTAPDGTVLWKGVPEIESLAQAETPWQSAEAFSELAAGSLEGEPTAPPKTNTPEEPSIAAKRDSAGRARAPVPGRSTPNHSRPATQANSLLQEAISALHKLNFKTYPLRDQIRNRSIATLQDGIKEIEDGRVPVQRLEDLRRELQDLRGAVKSENNQEHLDAAETRLRRAIELLQAGVPAASTRNRQSSSPE